MLLHMHSKSNHSQMFMWIITH